MPENVAVSKDMVVFLKANQIVGDTISEYVSIDDDSGIWVVSFMGVKFPCYSEEAAEVLAEEIREIMNGFTMNLFEKLENENLLRFVNG